MDEHLLSVLQLAKDAGVIGRTDLVEEISRARVFVAGLSTYPSDIAVLDIGSGGGLPGLVIAHDRPDVHVTLIDRREKRTDLLQRQATRLRQHQPGHAEHQRPRRELCQATFHLLPFGHRRGALPA